VIESFYTFAPTDFVHNCTRCVKFNNIGHAHIIQAVTALLFNLLYSFKYMYFKQITQYTLSRPVSSYQYVPVTGPLSMSADTIFSMAAILNICQYFTKAILAKMKTKPLSRITYLVKLIIS